MKKINLVLFLSLISTNSFADSSKATQLKKKQPKNSSWEVSLGLAGIAKSKIYQGTNDKFMAFPLINVRKGNFAFEVDKFKYDLLETNGLKFTANLGYQGSPYDLDDSTVLAGMDKKKSGALASLTTSYTFRNYNLQATVGSVLGQSEQGVQVNLGATYAQFLPSFLGGMLSLKYSLGVDYLDSKRSLYSYGVKSNEVNADLARTEYSAGQTLSPSMKIGTTYIFGERRNWILINNLSYTKLDSKIADSPIVEEDKDLGFISGLVRKF